MVKLPAIHFIALNGPGHLGSGSGGGKVEGKYEERQIQIHKYTNTQIHKYTNTIQIQYKYTNPNTQWWWWES